MAKSKKVKEAEPVEEAKPVEQGYSLTAKYKVIDKDGTKTFPEFKSEGGSAEDLLAGLEGYPKGLNSLVEVTISGPKGDFTKALAPHKARLILEYTNKVKALEAFNATFRGFV